MVTHMGQSPANHVTLKGTPRADARDNLEFFRIEADGFRATAPFTIPAGKVLVVTDVGWIPVQGNPGQFKTFQISIATVAMSNPPNTVFESTITLDNSGVGGTNVEMTSGFVVSSKGIIYVKAHVVNAGTDNEVYDQVILRGYLTEES